MSKPRSKCFYRVPVVLFSALAAGLLTGSRLALTQEVKPSPQPTPPPGSPSITLTPYADPWPLAQQRWWDIASKIDAYNQYNNWKYTPTKDEWDTTVGYASPDFNYRGTGKPNSPKVTLTYAKAPNVPYFVGHIEARHLKPNFAYQIKLVGKPRYGSRGAGPFTQKTPTGAIISIPNGGGEDWANSQLGHIGRWWNDSKPSGNTNAVTDRVYEYTYPTETIYGYIFMGDFVTDAAGNASVNFTGQNNYHITFQDWQSGRDVRMVQAGTPKQLTSVKGPKYFPIISSPRQGSAYGYGKVQPSTGQPEKNGLKNVYLWYQYESSMTLGRPKTVNLAPGRYRCRVMLTEESFHNNYGATNSAFGGKWQSVLITEDFAKAKDGRTNYNADGYATPDTSISNDVVFDIRDSNGKFVPAPVAPQEVNATVNPNASEVVLSWRHDAPSDSNTYFNIKRSETRGGPYTTIVGGVDTNNTSYSDATISPGKTYFYVVSAVTSGMEGPNSTASEVRTGEVSSPRLDAN